MLCADPGDNLLFLRGKISDDSLIDAKMLGEALHISLNSANFLHESGSSLQRMCLTCLFPVEVLTFCGFGGFFCLLAIGPHLAVTFFSSDVYANMTDL